MTIPLMVDIAARHPRLNLLNLEAAAMARLLRGTVWLSEESSAGILPGVLNDEGRRLGNHRRRLTRGAHIGRGFVAADLSFGWSSA